MKNTKCANKPKLQFFSQKKKKYYQLISLEEKKNVGEEIIDMRL